MAIPTVVIMGNDIYQDYVEKIINIEEKKSFDKVKLTVNTYKLPVLNRDNQFSLNNPVSMFHGNDWLYTNIKITNKDSVIIWDGSITSIPRDHKNQTAVIESKDSVFAFRNDLIEYESGSYETGADIFQAICDYAGYTNYNKASVSRSRSLLTNNNCYIKANINKSDQLTFQRAIEKIAILSNAYVFLSENELHFKVWEQYRGGSSIEITDSDFKDGFPTVDEDEASMINDYYIPYDGGIATDNANNDIGALSRSKNQIKVFNSRTGVDKQFVFQDLVSAVYIGEGKIRRSHKNLAKNPKPLTFMNFNLFSDFRNRLSLDTYIDISFSREAFENKIFEPFRYTIDENADNISLTVYEIPS